MIIQTTMMCQKHEPHTAGFIFPIFIEMLKNRLEKRALLAIDSIATPFYRTIMSLLKNLYRNLKAVNLAETSIVGMRICLLR